MRCRTRSRICPSKSSLDPITPCALTSRANSMPLKRFLPWCCASWWRTPPNTWGRKSRMRSLRCRLISMTPSAPPPGTRARSPASMCCASSTSPRPRRWRMGWTKKLVRPCWSSTWVAARSTCRSSKSGKASLKSSPPRAIRTWAVMTLTSAWSTGWPKSSSAIRALICGVIVRHCNGSPKPPRRRRSNCRAWSKRPSAYPSLRRTLLDQSIWRRG